MKFKNKAKLMYSFKSLGIDYLWKRCTVGGGTRGTFEELVTFLSF